MEAYRMSLLEIREILELYDGRVALAVYIVKYVVRCERANSN